MLAVVASTSFDCTATQNIVAATTTTVAYCCTGYYCSCCFFDCSNCSAAYSSTIANSTISLVAGHTTVVASCYCCLLNTENKIELNFHYYPFFSG